MQPTAAGRALIRKAVSLLAELDRTQQEIEAIHGGLIGTVRLGAGVSSCYVIVPDRVKAADGRSRPKSPLASGKAPMDELLARLRTGQIDLLVGRFGRDQDLSDIKTQDLYRPNVVAVCWVKHPLVSRRSLDWDRSLRAAMDLSRSRHRDALRDRVAFSQAKAPPDQGVGRSHPRFRLTSRFSIRRACLGLVVRRGEVFRAAGGAARPEGGAVARTRSFRPGSARDRRYCRLRPEASRLSTVGRKALAERAVVGLIVFALSIVESSGRYRVLSIRHENLISWRTDSVLLIFLSAGDHSFPSSYA